jgi:hypothetical protein
MLVTLVPLTSNLRSLREVMMLHLIRVRISLLDSLSPRLVLRRVSQHNLSRVDNVLPSQLVRLRLRLDHLKVSNFLRHLDVWGYWAIYPIFTQVCVKKTAFFSPWGVRFLNFCSGFFSFFARMDARPPTRAPIRPHVRPLHVHARTHIRTFVRLAGRMIGRGE